MSVVPNTVPNVGIINYQYQVDPNLPLESDSAESNLVITRLNNAELTIKKAVDKEGADLQDVLLYTLVLKNLGNTSANEVTVYDTIPSGTKFINDSVTVDNIQMLGVNPQTGILISNIPADGVVTITFNVQVITIPTVNPIPNDANVGYKYTVDPSIVNGKSNKAASNVVTVPVSHADLANIKGVDRKFATVGDEVEYRLTISNSGNVNADNVVLYDTIPKDTVFIMDSVFVDGVKKPGINPESGIQIGSIKPAQEVIVTFKIGVNTIPNINPIPNNARVSYNYIVENVGIKSVQKQTNFVNTKVNDADVSGVKSVDKNYSDLNEELTYTITLVNSGNAKADNLILYDTIPKYTEFIQNSVLVGGKPEFAVSPQTGISVGSLDAGKSITISFKVLVNTIPTENPIKNSGFVSYNFIIDSETGVTKKESLLTNIVVTTVSKAIVETVKTTSKEYANIGDEITYKIVFKNTGNVAAEDVIFIDTIPPDVVFVENSVTVNSAIVMGVNPESGIKIGSIEGNTTQTLTFRVKVIKIPMKNPIENSGKTLYSYTVNPAKPRDKKKETLTNIVKTRVNHADLDAKKLVDKNYAVIGETLTYSIQIKNNGNTQANNVIVKDLIPEDTMFVQGSVSVNNMIMPSANISSGVNIGTINQSETTILSFKVKVLNIPKINPIENKANINYEYTVDPNDLNGASDKRETNSVYTLVSEAIIKNEDGGLIKLVDKEYADLDDVLTYTINLKNTGNTTANNIILYDTIPEETTFVEGSVEINGSSLENENPKNGIYVGSILPNEESIVTFKVKVISIPKDNPIKNTSEVAYSFTSDPNRVNGEKRAYKSNQVSTNILSAIIDNKNGGLLKSVNSNFAVVGDVLTYKVLLKNTGNTDASDVTIYDAAPSGSKFVENSFRVDDSLKIGVNPEEGYNIGKIVAGGSVTVEFKVKVFEIPIKNPMENVADVSYIYTSNPMEPNGRSKRNLSNVVKTKVNEAYIRNEDGGFIKEVDKNYAIIGDALTYTIKLKNTGNVVATNILVRDDIPNGTEFIEGTVIVGGSSSVGSPKTGILVPNLGPGEDTMLLFKVRIVDILDKNPILNNASIQYTFTSDPIYPNSNKRDYKSNTVKTKINVGKIQAIKSVDKDFIKVLEEVTYFIELKNTGNVDVKDIVVFDNIKEGSEFILGSVEIDGVKKAGANPKDGIKIENIPVDGVKSVSFKVLVYTIPKENPIKNISNVEFSYIYDPETLKEAKGMTNSNEVKTKVNQAYIRNKDGGLVKTVSDSYASVDDVVEFTIILKNTGNTKATNINLVDYIKDGFSFIANSVTVNGMASSETPEEGIKIGDLLENQEAIIKFKALVSKIPEENPILNNAKVSYRFTKNPDIPNGEYEENLSNTTKTKINEAIIRNEDGGAKKSVDKAFADIGETVTYTIVLRNTGNTTADNVIVFDTVPEGIKFVKDSINVNGFNRLGETPETGITIGKVNVNTNILITFKGIVTKIPSVNPVENFADIAYTFIKNPENGEKENRRYSTNKVSTKINHAEISKETGGLSKNVNKAFVDVKEGFIYKVTLENKGNVSANNIVLTDTLKDGVTFIQNSVYVDGDNKLAVNPESGIFINSIEPNKKVEVWFSVTCVSLPLVNPVLNKAKVKYYYSVDPSVPNGAYKINETNEVSTKVNTADLSKEVSGIIKDGDKNFADIEDIITYKVVLTNKGNVSATNVVLLDTLADTVSFIKDSVVVDENKMPGTSPDQGIAVGVINPGQAVTITFKVKVLEVPDDNIVENAGVVSYLYTKDPSFPNAQSKEDRSLPFITEVRNANLLMNKGISKEYADIGDVLTYTFNIKNTGNVKASNVLLIDTIPSDLEFIENSASVNGAIIVGGDINSGVNIGEIKASEIVTVTFNVKVINAPYKNPVINRGKAIFKYTVDPNRPNGVEKESYSNIAKLTINHGEISNEDGGFTKTSDKKYAKIGDVITYKIYMKNTGNVNTDNVVMQDTLPDGTELVAGSVSLNDRPIMGANPQVGINIGTVRPNEESVLSFKVLVVSINEGSLPIEVNGLPCPSAGGGSGILENKAKVCYRYTVDPKKPCGVRTCNESNVDTIKVNTAIIELSKESTPTYLDLGDEIKFILKLKNTGNVLAEEILLKDVLDKSVEFVKNSIVINGVMQPGVIITEGISIGSLQPEEENTVEFLVKVVDTPKENEIKNIGVANYTFELNPETGERSASTAKSNETINYVNHGNLKSIKSVDKKYATSNEELTYKITLKNEGNIRVNNVEVFDTVPEGTTLKQGSVIINGVPKLGAIPQYGIFIGTIDSLEVVEISYKVLVDSISKNKVVVNSANIEYQYTVNPKLTNGVTKVDVTNTVETDINDAIISSETGSFKKTASRDYVDTGDTITYTIVAENIGTVSANNVVVKDILDSNTKYVNGSLSINDIPAPDVSLEDGIPVGVVEASKAITIRFDVKVIGVPKDGIIENRAKIDYSFIKNPEVPIEVNKTSYTKESKVNVKSGFIGNLTKVSDKEFLKVSDEVKFTVEGENIGNINLYDVVVSDILNEHYEFVKDSVTVNGSLRLGEDITKGIIIKELLVNKSFIVTFKARVSSIPEGQKLSNIAKVDYSYVINGDTVQKQGETNEDIVLVREANISYEQGGFEKLADKEFAQIGEVVTFYLSLKNTGNIVANNVFVEDPLPKEIGFKVGSVEINSNKEPIANIYEGISIGNINPGEMMIVKFDGVVKEIPEELKVSNEAFVSYSFVVNPDKPAITRKNKTNKVDIRINSIDLDFTKSVTPEYVAIGDITTFEFSLKNSGNLDANNVLFFDAISKGMEFIEDSVIVNGIPVPGVNPAQGISIGNLAIDEKVDIKFKVNIKEFSKSSVIKNTGLINFDSKVNPNEAPVKGTLNSNSVDIIVRSPKITVLKESNYDSAIVGDNIHYTATVNNSGNIEVTKLLLVDILASNLDFVEGSVTINGEKIASSNPSKGILVEELLPAETVIVEFDAIILESNSKIAKNKITAYYNYFVNPNKAPREGKVYSNENVISIENVDIKVNKTANREVVVLDDIITYKVVVENCGSVIASNVEFVDSLPNTVDLVDGSFKIDGITVNSVDVELGINIGSIYPKAKKVIEYSVKVKNVDCTGLVTNYAYVLFNANISQDSPVRRVQATPSSISIRAASPRFKEMNVDKTLAIPCQKPDIEEINEVIATAEVKNFYVIKTIKGVSTEGKRLTGYKLVLNGVISYNVEYTAATAAQSVHSAHYCEKFSSYIIIDEEAIPSPLANVIPEIEDVSWQMLDERTVFANVTMNIVIK